MKLYFTSFLYLDLNGHRKLFFFKIFIKRCYMFINWGSIYESGFRPILGGRAGNKLALSFLPHGKTILSNLYVNTITGADRHE